MEKVKLGDIATSIQTGPFGSQLHQSDYSDTGIPVVMPKNMVEGKIVEQSIARVSEYHINRLKRHKVSVGNIIYARRGDVGRCVLVTEKENGWLCGTGCFKVSIDLQKANPTFVFYQLQKPATIGWVEKHAVGATMPNLNTSILECVPLELPNLQTQNKIVNILSAYDSLIENNNKRIKLLENMAMEIYKEWFVRFRFPNYKNTEFKNSELGKIPTTFNVLKANEVFEYYVGGGWGNDEYTEEYPVDAYVIRGADFPLVKRSNVSSCPYRYHKTSNYKSRKLRVNDLVFEISGGTAEQPVGRTVLITQGILDQLSDKVICASFCKLIRPDFTKVTANYLYYWFQFLYDTRMIEKFQLQSTGIINFKFDFFLRKGPILVPTLELMNEFEKHIIPIRKEIDKLAIQNQNLIRQRDALLPRLMSGRLAV
ncbi:MAG: restriction endonuclease subunit S [Bacteroidales bacterium]|nr:restriction endonuclease subunit S [Bacteroidales bacterium]